MTKHTSAIVRIAASREAAALSKEQKTFNRLTKKIEGQRKLLQDWQTTLPVYEARRVNEYVPLLRQFDELRAQMVKLLDVAHDSDELGKRDKAVLAEFISTMAAEVLANEPTPELVAVYNKYSDTGFEEEQRIATEAAKSMAEEMFGMDLSDAGDMQSPEDLLRAFEKKMLEQQAQAAEEPPEPPVSKRKPTAREAKLQQEAQEASRSVRDVYRQLASALHPDREPDAAERDRKTALMQRVNAAYDAKDLLQLLELQLQIEQIDQATIGNLSEARLKHYNKVLSTQSSELQMELDQMEMSFDLGDLFGMGPPANPHMIMSYLEDDLFEVREQIATIQIDLEEFTDPRVVRAFLRSQYPVEPEYQMLEPRAGKKPKAKGKAKPKPKAEPKPQTDDPLQPELF